MPVRLLKIFFGLLLLSATISEFKELCFLFEDKLTTIINFVIIACLCLLLIHRVARNKKHNYYINTKCLLIFVVTLLSSTVFAYTVEAAENPHVMEFKQHNFSAKFPAKPKAMKLRPKADKTQFGGLGGYHLSCELKDYLYIVMYGDYRQSNFEKIPESDILMGAIKSLTKNFPPKIVDIEKYVINNRKAYIYDYMIGDRIIGKGLTCLGKNRVYNVICAYKGENPNFQTINDFILSFKITD